MFGGVQVGKRGGGEEREVGGCSGVLFRGMSRGLCRSVLGVVRGFVQGGVVWRGEGLRGSFQRLFQGAFQGAFGKVCRGCSEGCVGVVWLVCRGCLGLKMAKMIFKRFQTMTNQKFSGFVTFLRLVLKVFWSFFFLRVVLRVV